MAEKVNRHDADNSRDPLFRTADRVLIRDGLRVWDYDLKPGSVDFTGSSLFDSPYWNGWFNVITDDGQHSLMNGERLCTKHPTTGEAPSPAPDKLCDYCDQPAERISKDSGEPLCKADARDQYENWRYDTTVLTPHTLKKYSRA